VDRVRAAEARGAHSARLEPVALEVGDEPVDVEGPRVRGAEFLALAGPLQEI